LGRSGRAQGPKESPLVKMMALEFSLNCGIQPRESDPPQKIFRALLEDLLAMSLSYRNQSGEIIQNMGFDARSRARE
jgi:hypothetical protein